MWSTLVASGLLLTLGSAKDTGNHPEWPRWCGKAYQPKYPSFDPGGQVAEPDPLPGPGPSLYMQIQPRYSLYLESEDAGEFVVRAQRSEWYGGAWPDMDSPAHTPPVNYTINLVSNQHVLVSNTIPVGTEAVVQFSFGGLKPRLEPYDVILYGSTPDGSYDVVTTSELMYLPEKEDGSVTKLDNWKGGMMFRNPETEGKFEPLLPYGFYASCEGFLCGNNSISAIQKYSDLGLNGMVPLTTIGDSRPVYEFMDKLDLKFMYDFRSIFQNLTEVKKQVKAIKDFDALYSYWGVDEPDGWQYPFDDPVRTRDLIRSIDPYHPVAVTLNCQNYYFDQYIRGADFIMEDAYPIGINSTFSKWGTPCNTTYGDCGCDNCQGNVQDVSSRLDDLAQWEEWLGFWPKTKAHNPQSFHGEDYWSRDPTVEEEVAMNALAFNHDAKSIISWVWPTSDDLAKIHGKFASVVAKAPVRDFIALERAQKVKTAGWDIVDAAYWQSESEILLSVVNAGYTPINETVKITLPDSAVPKSVKSNVWGNAEWQLIEDGVQIAHMGNMSTYMAIMEV